MRRSLTLRLLLSLLVGLITLGALEGGAWLANRQLQLDLCLQGEMEFDRELFWVLPRHGWRDRVPVDIGPLRLREHLHHAPPQGRQRRTVVCLGDSSIFGWGVQPDETFAARLEVRLGEACPGYQWVVINGGVPGYSSYQSLRLLERHEATLAPDLLVLGNLFDDAMRWRWADRELAEHLASPAARLSMGLRDLALRSQVGRAGTCALRHRAPGVFGQRESIPWESLRRYAEEDLGGQPRITLDEYRANLAAMMDLVEARGGGAVGLLLVREGEARGEEDGAEMDRYRQAMNELLAERGYPVADMRGPFSAGLEEHPTLWLDGLHPDATGHGIIADELAGLIEASPACAAPERADQGAGAVR
jgi:lysophospholipase L1-like esterase